MELNNYNGVHILSEAVIMGGISMYFYKEISELKSTIEDLKGQITMQNNQIRYLLSFHQPQQPSGFVNHHSPLSQQTTTPLNISGLKIPQSPHVQNHHNYALEQQQRQLLFNREEPKVEIKPLTQENQCEGGVCRLVPKTKTDDIKKTVVISKISKQIEFDGENIERDQTFKVNTFSNFSPNPVLKSITPKPSTSINPLETDICEGAKSTLKKILSTINDE